MSEEKENTLTEVQEGIVFAYNMRMASEAQTKAIREKRKADEDEFRRNLPGVKSIKMVYEHIVHIVFAAIVGMVGVNVVVWGVTGVIYAAKALRAVFGG